MFLNPIDHVEFDWHCLLDTGAAASLFTADLAEATGHDLQADGVKTAYTMGVEARRVTVWQHTFVLHVMHPKDTTRVIWKDRRRRRYACSEYRGFPQILGINDFLRHFVIRFDLPKEQFSIAWED